MTLRDDDQPSSFHRAFGRCACAACGGGAQREEVADVGPSAAPPASPAGAAAAFELSPTTGDVRVDGLLSGLAWAADEAASRLVITYSFGLTAASYGTNYGYGEPLNGFAALSSVGRSAVREALGTWSAVADIEFVEVGEGTGDVGTMRFASSAEPETAWGYYPHSDAEGGDVWLGPYFRGSAFERGSYEWHTLVHEIGHALGLKHPHEPFDVLGEAAALPEALDWLGQSVMSYRDFAGDSLDYYTAVHYPGGPMALDILAVQHLYGANATHNVGDTVYSFAPGERLFQTIWDAGGIDTLDWSNQSTSAVVRLTEGSFSDLGQGYGWWEDDGVHSLPGTVAIAYGAEIENANGGSGADKLYGNPLDNRLEGGRGADLLSGSIGDDVLIGGTSPDTISGGSGHDVLAGGTSYDTLIAGSGNDVLFGETGSDILIAGSGDDFLIGGTGNDQLDGGSGFDIAVYDGSRHDFIITQTKTGWSVRDGNSSDGALGLDDVTGVQALLFDDGLYDLRSRTMSAPPRLPELDQLVLTA